MWLPASAASIYSTVAPESVAACVEDRGMDVGAALAEGAKEGRRGGGEGVTDGVRKRDVWVIRSPPVIPSYVRRASLAQLATDS